MNLKEAFEIAQIWRTQENIWLRASDPSLSSTSKALIILADRAIELENELNQEKEQHDTS